MALRTVGLMLQKVVELIFFFIALLLLVPVESSSSEHPAKLGLATTIAVVCFIISRLSILFRNGAKAFYVAAECIAFLLFAVVLLIRFDGVAP